ncbi:MAG: NADH:ubiquinone reductase (Na(+)-transporting) subunit B [Bacteroidales bacterium]|nr:NADH:ubiquinone reductase (Na(+)-transporting) subunit B [Bacteroidales bacterium]
MRWIEKISSNLEEKWFAEGRPLHALYAAYDAIDTFLLTPKNTTKTGCHIRDSVDMKRIMMTVILALMPPLLFGLWNVGYQHYLTLNETVTFWQQFFYGFLKWLPIVIVTYASGLFVEIIFAQIRKHQVAEGFFVSGMIIPMIMPPDIPLWIVSLATIFAVLIGKEVFGGNGYNFINPALLARGFIFFAYPPVISGDKVWVSAPGDAISGATPLANAKVGLIDQIPSSWDMFIGTIPGCIGETSKLAILIGACILIFTGVASLRIMFSVTAGGFVTAWLFHIFGTTAYAAIGPLDQMLMGGLFFATVYMATDPVSSSHTKVGQWIYGTLIGVLTILVRQVNQGYVEGLILGLFIMNILAPLIDWCVIQVNINQRKRRALVVQKR